VAIVAKGIDPDDAAAAIEEVTAMFTARGLTPVAGEPA
jgi:hypothetical protein